jgi:hypothetical protein
LNEEIQLIQAQDLASGWVKATSTRKTRLTIADFREYLDSTIIPQVWVPEDAYTKAELETLALECEVPTDKRTRESIMNQQSY